MAKVLSVGGTWKLLGTPLVAFLAFFLFGYSQKNCNFSNFVYSVPTFFHSHIQGSQLETLDISDITK